jgi:superfamily I DNA and RNA helicase
MFDLVLGSTTTTGYEKDLISRVLPLGDDGTLFIGYPIVVVDDSKIEIDALLTSKRHGIVAFDTKNYGANLSDQSSSISEKQSAIFAALHAKLIEHPGLREGRKLALEPTVVSWHASADMGLEDETQFVSPASLGDFLHSLTPISDERFRSLNSVVQRSTSLRPRKKRESVERSDSKGSILKRIEREIANFDAWQKKAALEMPNGPQRIRGLAGSGKTIVLAQKASFLHVKHPDWRIVLTFQTRSLYQQLRDLVRRFTFEAIRDEPDWSKLTIMHAWGGSSAVGVYSELASHFGQPVRDFGYAKSLYGAANAFGGVTEELLRSIPGDPEPLYDAVLIDEAQDLPRSFFEICYHATKKPHRVVYAYDELQNLSDHDMTPPEELFGKEKGKPRVKLEKREGEPAQDLILPVCYRNPPWTLSTAHALGFGIYRENGLVQLFDEVGLWNEIGYQSANGQIALGQHVSIVRNPNASPRYFNELLDPKESLVFKGFPNREAQMDWVAASIKAQLENDEVEHDDILIVVADPLTVRRFGSQMISRLAGEDIDAHLVGVTSGVDELFQKESVAITSIFRAKGNEAPIVYFIDADHCVNGIELSKRRNILFTAMTRSRGWMYVCGVGEEMDTLIKEHDRVVACDFKLTFDYPDRAALKKIRTLHKEMAPEEISMVTNDLAALSRLLERIEAGYLSLDALPKKVREQIAKLGPSGGRE